MLNESFILDYFCHCFSSKRLPYKCKKQENNLKSFAIYAGEESFTTEEMDLGSFRTRKSTQATNHSIGKKTCFILSYERVKYEFATDFFDINFDFITSLTNKVKIFIARR